MDAFHGLVEVLQPIAVPVDIEDMGFVEEPVEDSGGGHLIAGKNQDPVRDVNGRAILTPCGH